MFKVGELAGFYAQNELEEFFKLIEREHNLRVIRTKRISRGEELGGRVSVETSAISELAQDQPSWLHLGPCVTDALCVLREKIGPESYYIHSVFALIDEQAKPA